MCLAIIAARLSAATASCATTGAPCDSMLTGVLGRDIVTMGVLCARGVAPRNYRKRCFMIGKPPIDARENPNCGAPYPLSWRYRPDGLRGGPNSAVCAVVYSVTPGETLVRASLEWASFVSP